MIPSSRRAPSALASFRRGDARRLDAQPAARPARLLRSLHGRAATHAMHTLTDIASDLRKATLGGYPSAAPPHLSGIGGRLSPDT